MPIRKEDIFRTVVGLVEDAVNYLESYGCGSGLPRTPELLFQAYGLLRALTSSERDEFYELVPTIDRAVGEVRLKCSDIPQIRKEIEKYREWETGELLRRLGRR